MVPDCPYNGVIRDMAMVTYTNYADTPAHTPTVVVAK